MSGPWRRNGHEAALAFDPGEGGPAWTDERVAEACGGTARERPARRRLGGEEEARLVALACSKPPEGSARWTLRLLADRMVELEAVDGLSHETVRRALEKTRSSPGAA